MPPPGESALGRLIPLFILLTQLAIRPQYGGGA
jgi:hypothetical protein